MNVLINYADSKYESTRKFNSRTAKFFGKFDKIYEFSPNDIDPVFYKDHSDIFDYSRGNGLWLWKPYFIEKIIRESEDGTNIFYVDSGSFFLRDPRILLDYISDDSPIFVCDQPLVESCWTKPSVFDALEAWEFKDENQIWCGFHMFKVNDFTRSFYKQWLDLCCRHELISPLGLGKSDKFDKYYGSEFVSHREDQSIFSILCHRYNIKAHRDISQRGFDPMSFYQPYYTYKEPSHENDSYRTIIYLHKHHSIGIGLLKKIVKNRLSILINKYRKTNV